LEYDTSFCSTDTKNKEKDGKKTKGIYMVGDSFIYYWQPNMFRSNWFLPS